MALAIDGEGYFINAQGQRFDQSLQGNQAAWKQAIEDTRAKAEANGADTGDLPPPENETSCIVVEKGDCLWSIAEEAGVDPAQLSYKDNEQFEANPDLIHPGDIVFVRKAPPASTEPSEPADPALTNMEAAAANGHTWSLNAQLWRFVGQVQVGNDPGPAFEAVANHDWGEHRDTVMQALQNVTLRHLENPVPVMGAVGGSSGLDFDSSVRQYVRAYLSALPGENRRSAAEGLSEHEWDNPEYMEQQINMVWADMAMS